MSQLSTQYAGERGREAVRGVNPIPDKLINARIYNENGAALLGIGTVTLPELEYMSEAVSGLGISGELDTPVIGHFKSFQIKISWNSVAREAVDLLRAQSHKLEIRAAVQYSDPSSGTYASRSVKVLVWASPKKFGLGKTESGKKMDNESDMEVEYIKMWMEGEEILEIDKLNFVCVINGRDQLAKVRQDLGFE